MLITYRRTGGFASFPGLERPVTIDSQELEPDQRSALEQALGPLVALPTGDLLPGELPGDLPAGAADHRTYTVEITDDSGGSRTVRLTDPVPEAARSFLDYVEDHRRQQRGR